MGEAKQCALLLIINAGRLGLASALALRTSKPRRERPTAAREQTGRARVCVYVCTKAWRDPASSRSAGEGSMGSVLWVLRAYLYNGTKEKGGWGCSESRVSWKQATEERSDYSPANLALESAGSETMRGPDSRAYKKALALFGVPERVIY